MSIKEQVKELREQGKTYREIAKELGIAKSTVSYHCGVRGKPKPKKLCRCGKEKDHRSKICRDCSNEYRAKLSNITIDSTIGDKTYTNHKYAKYGYIRWHARKTYLALGINSCENCGYSKHIEVSHIKGVASFPPETTIRQVNTIENLIGLCPNCHWEFDHDNLTLEQIKSSRQDSNLNCAF